MSLQVEISSLNGDVTYVTAEPSWTVGQMKLAIEVITEALAMQQSLAFGDDVLDDNVILASVAQDDVLELALVIKDVSDCSGYGYFRRQQAGADSWAWNEVSTSNMIRCDMHSVPSEDGRFWRPRRSATFNWYENEHSETVHYLLDDDFEVHERRRERDNADRTERRASHWALVRDATLANLIAKGARPSFSGNDYDISCIA